MSAEDQNTLCISSAESGQKLLRFLEKKLAAPRPYLYRWLRTGQIRVNKGRANPNTTLSEGDLVRLPPQAISGLREHVQSPVPVPKPISATTPLQKLANKVVLDASLVASTGFTEANDATAPSLEFTPIDATLLGPELRVLLENANVIALNKAPGLPSQPGTGHDDSVSTRLKNAGAHLAFTPAPVHRLDKQSSGIIIAAKSHLYSRFLHELFHEAKPLLARDYLFWVAGTFRLPEGPAGQSSAILEDVLVKETDAKGFEKMRCLGQKELNGEGKPHNKGKGVKGIGLYKVLRHFPASPVGPATLLKARLITGRKHQIRVQMASRGFPIIGDVKYGGPPYQRMLLHANHITLPKCEDYHGLNAPAVEVSCDPEWGIYHPS